jgi:hypothetical protein
LRFEAGGIAVHSTKNSNVTAGCSRKGEHPREDSMPSKERKTAAELAMLVKNEIQNYPECRRIVSFAITRPVRRALDHPNWDVAFVAEGNIIVPESAHRIARQFQAQFDLA